MEMCRLNDYKAVLNTQCSCCVFNSSNTERYITHTRYPQCREDPIAIFASFHHEVICHKEEIIDGKKVIMLVLGEYKE
jgi:hypothetical protein